MQATQPLSYGPPRVLLPTLPFFSSAPYPAVFPEPWKELDRDVIIYSCLELRISLPCVFRLPVVFTPMEWRCLTRTNRSTNYGTKHKCLRDSLMSTTHLFKIVIGCVKFTVMGVGSETWAPSWETLTSNWTAAGFTYLGYTSGPSCLTRWYCTSESTTELECWRQFSQGSLYTSGSRKQAIMGRVSSSVLTSFIHVLR